MLLHSAFLLAVAVLGYEVNNGFVEVPGLRCTERVDNYPIGHQGGLWTDYVHHSAVKHCRPDEACHGFMRFIGSNTLHCQIWCGRPQFCSPGQALERNGNWVSYLKVEHLKSFDWPSPTGDAAVVDCTGELNAVAEAPVVLVTDFEPASMVFAGPDACRVLRRCFGQSSLYPPAGARHLESLTQVHGILEEGETEDLPYFSADLPRTHNNLAAPWRYFVERQEYPAPSLGTPGVKRHFMSVYFLSPEAVCQAPNGTVLLPEDAELELPGHVYVDDGTHESRKLAFEAYEITLMCGDFSTVGFPPPPLVYSLAWASHPIVPKVLHRQLSRVTFHMPDAAQGYRNVNIQTFQRLFKKMFNDPNQTSSVNFKQTFMFLGQLQFFYRYREPPDRREEVAACSLCEHRARERRRQEEHVDDDNVGKVSHVFCSMSRRVAHELRRAVRETWGGEVLRRQREKGDSSIVMRFFVGQSADAGGAPIGDAGMQDVVELPVVESYRTINVKAFLMIKWASKTFPNLSWLIRHDDDVYLRPGPLLAKLEQRPPIRYLWGNIDHGSSPVRDPEHLHYNTYEQCPERKHPVWGDIFPPYARGHLWMMSVDLLSLVVSWWKRHVEDLAKGRSNEALAESLPHPDDPALGYVLSQLVAQGVSVNLDDRDFNAFSLNPSCDSTFSNIHNRTLVVHHVSIVTMRCMWEVDRHILGDPSKWPDLCSCSTDVEEDEDPMEDGHKFNYAKDRFNE